MARQPFLIINSFKDLLPKVRFGQESLFLIPGFRTSLAIAHAINLQVQMPDSASFSYCHNAPFPVCSRRERADRSYLQNAFRAILLCSCASLHAATFLFRKLED